MMDEQDFKEAQMRAKLFLAALAFALCFCSLECGLRGRDPRTGTDARPGRSRQDVCGPVDGY